VQKKWHFIPLMLLRPIVGLPAKKTTVIIPPTPQSASAHPGENRF
jgi:hypothetical protein